jgi:purine-cytosine permease-like protein
MSIDNSIFSEIPEKNLKKWPSFTVFVSTLLIQITSLMFGFNLRLLTDFQTFILAIILADFILFGLFFVSGYVGMKKRLPTATLYSRIFGNLGCKIVMLLMLPIGLIWMAWMTEMVANSLLGLYPSLNYLYLVILIISVSVLSSIKDIKGMEISSYIQVPIVLLMIITACIRLFVNGVKVADICPLEKINLYQSVSYVLLTWINFLPFYSDYTRFVKSKKDLTLSTGICWGIIYSLVMIAGGLFASCGGNNFDLIKVLRIAGIPVFAMPDAIKSPRPLS